MTFSLISILFSECSGDWSRGLQSPSVGLTEHPESFSSNDGPFLRHPQSKGIFSWMAN